MERRRQRRPVEPKRAEPKRAEPKRPRRRDSSNQQGTQPFPGAHHNLKVNETFQKERRILRAKFVVPLIFCIDKFQLHAHRYRIVLIMIRVALVEPEIPPNTGNVARLCAANHVPLHIVGVAGFRLDDRAVRRAGLDYWPEVTLQRHSDIDALHANLSVARFLYFSTKGERSYSDCKYGPEDCLVFGRETRGLPESLLRQNWDRCLTIPMLNPKVRSLNLATAVAIVLYEALRQLGAFRQ